MKKATRVFAYMGAAFGFGIGLLLIVLSFFAFGGAFKYLPPFLQESSRTVFNIFILVYGIFVTGVGALSLHHYFYEKNNDRDSVYAIFILVLSVFSLNIFSIISMIFSLIILKNETFMGLNE